MKVRAFMEKDYPQIRELILSILAEEYPFDKSVYSESDLYSLGETYGGPRDAFFVIDEGGKIVGTGGIKEETEDTALLRRMFVEPKSRRRGYGRLLLNEAVDFCKKTGYRRMVFRTTSKMTVAIELCKKKGFKEIESADLGGFKIYKFALEI